jgi:hypothetical protein
MMWTSFIYLRIMKHHSRMFCWKNNFELRIKVQCFECDEVRNRSEPFFNYELVVFQKFSKYLYLKIKNGQSV